MTNLDKITTHFSDIRREISLASRTVIFFTWMCCRYISSDTIVVSSARHPSSIMMKYSSVSVLIYSPGILHTTISLPSCASITAVSSNDSNTTVGDVASSCLIFILFRIPSTHALPLIDPSNFYFSNINNRRASLFYSQVSDTYARGPMASRLCIWVIYFMTASAPFWGDFFSPFFGEYCVIRKCDIIFWNSSL